MKRSLLFSLAMLSVCSLFGQSPAEPVMPTDFCSQHHKHNALMQDPAFAAQYAADQLKLKQHELQMTNDPATRGTVYTIPVVFHVLHNGGIENITRDQILDAISIMNRDYRRLNADALTVHADFQGLPADVEVEFVLATKAPDGTCFSGITRTQSSMTTAGDDGRGQVDAVIEGNDVYNGEWPGDQYLNVFVCANIGGAAGYAYYPSDNAWIGTSMYNGIHVLHNYTGSIGTSSITSSRTMTHEVGHWLNLMHTWGGTNDPVVSCGSDEVDDTPETRGTQGCNLNENFCGPRANVENYMDYSYCFKMFTPGQAARMRAALTGSVGNRQNLWTPQNLAATGAGEAPVLCSAAFSTPRTAICTGETIQFEDNSFNAVTAWTWTFAGGTPANSSVQHPLVTYSTPGTYAVTLSATDGTTTLVKTKTAYITVYGPGEGIPYFEGFEGLTTFNGSQRWMVNNSENNNTWEITNTAANSGNRSARLGNFGQPVDNVDELVSAPVNLSGITDSIGATLSFRFAYRKRQAVNDDYLKVFLTKDCGDGWDQRKTLHASTLSNETATASWTPGQADWTTVHMTNVTSAYWVPNFRFKFRFESDGGNNIFLDDINIYSGDPSETIVVGVTEQQAPTAVSVYPNPADEEVHVQFSLSGAQAVTVTIVDLTGNKLQQQLIQANEGNNLVLLSTQQLAPGMYFIRLSGDGSQSALPFVVR